MHQDAYTPQQPALLKTTGIDPALLPQHPLSFLHHVLGRKCPYFIYIESWSAAFHIAVWGFIGFACLAVSLRHFHQPAASSGFRAHTAYQPAYALPTGGMLSPHRLLFLRLAVGQDLRPKARPPHLFFQPSEVSTISLPAVWVRQPSKIFHCHPQNLRC